MAATAQLSSTRLPWRTLTLCAIVLCTQAIPALHSAMLFERDAILQGQLWRVLSGNLVHYSQMHLLLNVSAMLVAGGIVETRGYRHYWLLIASSCLAIGCAVLWLRPDIVVYAGLSGVVNATVVYLCLHGLYEDRVWRRVCIFMLAMLCLKLGIELYYDTSLAKHFDTTLFLPIPLSHLVGALTGLGIFLGHRKQVLSQ